MVCMKLNTLSVISAATASISVPVKYILPHVVAAQLFALLVVFTFGDRFVAKYKLRF